jgi:hypothetical protein
VAHNNRAIYTTSEAEIIGIYDQAFHKKSVAGVGSGAGFLHHVLKRRYASKACAMEILSGF